MNAFDAIVIGAGVDEIVAALLLAKTGRRVLLLDERDPAIAENGEAVFRRGWVPAEIVSELDLDRHGLLIRQPDPWASAALPAGGRLDLWMNMERTVASIRNVSARDAGRWPLFCERMSLLAGMLAPLCVSPPPDPLTRDAGDLLGMGFTALRTRGLGRQAIEDFFRLLPMPVSDLLDDWFENDALKGLLGIAGVAHLRHGPRSGGTAFRLLQGHLGNPPGVFRPPPTNLALVLDRLLESQPGIEARRNVAIASIPIREGRVTGVTLREGEEFSAPIVASGADPARTLLEWSDPAWLDPALGRALHSVRRRGVVAKVTLHLDHAPGFQMLSIAPSLDYLERAADDAKYGRVSSAPFVECRSVKLGGAEVRSAGSPRGRHRVEAHVQYAPHALAEGSWNETRCGALGDLVVAMLAQALPGFESTLRERTVLSPPDLERLQGWPEGQAHHAESTLDQMLWMRPVPALARYRTPIVGLYQCGPAMHPGAGIAGAAGRNAARRILEDLRRPSN